MTMPVHDPAGPSGTLAAVTMPSPWWLGLPGIDPGCPVASLQHAAELIAAALAGHYLALESAGSRLFNAPGPAYKIAGQWQAWLADSTSTADLQLRRVTLHVILEDGTADRSNVLRTADDLYQAVRARRDRTW
jgi:hypothetical protein